MAYTITIPTAIIKTGETYKLGVGSNSIDAYCKVVLDHMVDKSLSMKFLTQILATY